MIDVASGVVYWYHYDGLGSVVALSKWNSGLSQGEVVERYTYDAFGRTRIFDATGGELTQSAFGNPYMYTGRRYDPETGLYHYRARAYSPDLGRFLQPDPIGYADSMNLYQYCLNNPINWIDPWGLCKSKEGDIGEYAALESFKPVPGKPGQQGWEYRFSRGHTPKDPAHYQLRKRGKPYARRVYPDGTQKPHGPGINKSIPARVINALKNIPFLLFVVPTDIIEAAFPGIVPRARYEPGA